MSLVVALAGEHEIVIAAERLCLLGDQEGQYKADISKIRRLNRGITVGVAGSRSGLSLLEKTERLLDGPLLSRRESIHEYAKQAAEVYGRSFEEMKFLFCAVENEQPLLYVLNFGQGRTSFPTEVTEGRAAVGLSKHGALHFLHTYHSRQMKTAELAFLAYFSIHQAIRNDTRLKGPIEMYVIGNDSVTPIQDEGLDAIRAASETAETAIGDVIRDTSLKLPRLIY